MLSVFCDSVVNGEYHLNINHLSMFQRYILALYKIRETLHDWFSLMYPPAYLENEARLGVLVGAIFVGEAACSSQTMSGSSQSRACGPLKEAAAVMQGFVEREGDVEVKKARAACGVRGARRGGEV